MVKSIRQFQFLTRWHAVTAFVVGVGLIITVGSFLLVKQWGQDRLQARFEATASVYQALFSARINLYISEIETIRRLFNSSNWINRDDFRSFVEPILVRFPDIQALELIPRVPNGRRLAHELAAHDDGLKDYQIREKPAQGKMVKATRRDVYFPVFYVEPISGNEAVIGFDIASDAARLATLEEARDSGRSVATGRITLFQDTERENGFLIFVPIYRLGFGYLSIAERRENLEGFAIGVFRVGDTLEEVLYNLESDLVNILILDQSAPAENRFLYYRSWDVSHKPPTGLTEIAAVGPNIPQYTTDFEVAGRRWSMQVSASPKYLAKHSQWQSWAVLFTGLALTAALMAYLIVIRRNAATEARTAKRTAELEERKKTEVQLRQYTLKLKQANRELEEFSYVASHDLQEPLRTVISYSKLLEQDVGEDLSEEAREDLRFIREATERMRNLIKDLLELSRVGRKDSYNKSVDLGECMKLVMDNLRTRTEKTGGTVEYQNLPLVLGNQREMISVLQNLVGNALKFHGEEPPHIKVSARKLDDRWEISVADNGIGISEDYVDKIFAPFKRLHGAANYDGTGIGLAIVRKILEHHGGEITVDSIPDEGTTFRFTLSEWAKTAPFMDKEMMSG